METLTLIGPAYWASYLINGDATGFDYQTTPSNPDAADAELAQANAFAKWCGGPIVSCSEESFFAWHHDASQFGVLACDCVEYTILLLKTVHSVDS